MPRREGGVGWGGVGWGGEVDWRFGMSRCKLPHTGWINEKVPLYGTGNSIQYPVINPNIRTHTHISESLHCSPVTQVINQHYVNKTTF